MDTLFQTRNLKWLLLLSAMISASYAFGLFGPGFVFGTAPFWSNPIGTMAGSQYDLVTIVSAYFAYLQSPWDLSELFYTHKLNSPTGTFLAHTDAIPAVALLGKMLFSLTGKAFNLMSIWTAFALAMNGIAFALLIMSIGHRSIFSVVVATLMGLMMPALLWRFGHLSLMAHFVFIIPLAAYLYSRRNPQYTMHMGWVLWAFTFLALLLTPYLFAMAFGLLAAFTLQALWSKQLKVLYVALAGIGLALLSYVTMKSLGYIGANTLSGAYGYGVYSMNLMAPFWPQTSGAFTWTGIYWLDRGSIGATPGQYEGYNYLGLGILLLLGLSLLRPANWLRAIKSHPVMSATFVFMTLFAVSHRGFLGPIGLWSLPIPEGPLLDLLNQFRSSGRFFWPVGYALAGFALHQLLRNTNQKQVLVIALFAVFLQFIDTSILQGHIYERTRATPELSFDHEAMKELMSKHANVEVYPVMHCQQWPNPQLATNGELMLLGARLGVNSNDLHSARGQVDCDANTQLPRELHEDTLYIALGAEASNTFGITPALSGYCKDFERGIVCSRSFGQP